MRYELGLLLLIAFLAGLSFLRLRKTITVFDGSVAVLYRDGKFQRELPPGRHSWFDPFHRLQTKSVASVPVALHAHELTVLTKDQFSFRLSLVPIAHLVDARSYFETAQNSTFAGYSTASLDCPSLHAELAAKVLESVSQRTLEEVLADPLANIDGIKRSVSEATPGVAIEKLLLTGITMPPEVRKMFTEVERAKREGLASLERARAETASLRALANAARSLQSNPDLAQFRVLQTIEMAKGNKTFVLGSDGLATLGRDRKSES